MKCIAPKCPLDAEVGAVFCKTHLAAPNSKRGGWLSAHRRARIMGGNVEAPPLDASNIAKRLWVGARPPFDRDLPEFDILVLCAEEIQPDIVPFHGIVHRCALPDQPLNEWQTKRALQTGKKVARHLVAGRTVLVTCNQGRNRSALVAGLGLGLVTQMSASNIIELIRQRRRPDCLENRYFVAMLQRFVPGKRPSSVKPPTSDEPDSTP